MNNREMKEIAHRYDQKYFNSFKDRIHTVSNILFNEIHVEGIEHIENKEDHSLIFASNHKSLGDIVAVTEVFNQNNISMPRFIGGNNLYVRGFTRFPIFTRLPDLKKCGMISIDRTKFKEKDISYIKSFLAYMNTFLKEKENLFFYPEGGRTYEGGLKEFETGLLNIILKQANESTILVPTYNNYDMVIESPAFEYSSSTKFSKNKKFKRFVDDFKLFYAHYKLDYSVYNDAYVSFGNPISLHGKKLDELTYELKDAYLDLTKITPAELVSFVLVDDIYTGDIEAIYEKMSTLVNITPKENLSTYIKEHKADVSSIFRKGLSSIQLQYELLGTTTDACVKDSFLVQYYMNSVRTFYDRVFAKQNTTVKRFKTT